METINIKTELTHYIGDESMSAAARRMGVTPSYLSRVMNGIKPPSERILKALSLRVVYDRIPPAAVPDAQRTPGQGGDK